MLQFHLFTIAQGRRVGGGGGGMAAVECLGRQWWLQVVLLEGEELCLVMCHHGRELVGGRGVN